MPKRISVGTLAGLFLARSAVGCEVKPPCPDVNYFCPEGTEDCMDEDGCDEYTFGEGDCAETLDCMDIEDTDAE